MALHRELFNDLPPAGELLRAYDQFFKTAQDADGYYVLVQHIAEKYGDQAYALAEQVFEEFGLKYDPAELRTPCLVRRTGYNFEGQNVYHILIKEYEPAMANDLARLYNREIRLLSRAAVVEPEFFVKLLQSEQDHQGFYVACNEAGQPVGFVHCKVDEVEQQGSLEALIFSSGRIYAPVASKLISTARDYFAYCRVSRVTLLAGKAPYPFYRVVQGDLLAQVAEKLSHIHSALVEIAVGR